MVPMFHQWLSGVLGFGHPWPHAEVGPPLWVAAPFPFAKLRSLSMIVSVRLVPFPPLPYPEQQVTGERDHDQLTGRPLR
jgi:hypothetical protein